MGTNDYIQQVLNRTNQASPAVYAGAAADYEPDPALDNGYFLAKFGDMAVDRIFRDGSRTIANDLVVPSDGVHQANGHPSFPLSHPLLFTGRDHVWHTGLFRRRETFAAIKRHFEMPAAVVAGTGLGETGAELNRDTGADTPKIRLRRGGTAERSGKREARDSRTCGELGRGSCPDSPPRRTPRSRSEAALAAVLD
jgi:hypothetical protein